MFIKQVNLTHESAYSCKYRRSTVTARPTCVGSHVAGILQVIKQLSFQRHKSFKKYEALLCQNAKYYQKSSHNALCLFTEFPSPNSYSGQNSQGFS